MVCDLKKYGEWLVRKEGSRDELLRQRDTLRLKGARAAETAGKLESARDVVNAVLRETQQQVKGFIEEVVSLALSSVYGSGYAFELEYDVKRNQSEAIPWIVKDGDRFSPREEVGGGVNDVASFALRLAVWSLMSPRSMNVFVLDEPGKFISGDKASLFGEMMKKVSEMLDIQIVFVSHAEDLIEFADVAYSVAQMDGVSCVTRIEDDQ